MSKGKGQANPDVLNTIFFCFPWLWNNVLHSFPLRDVCHVITTNRETITISTVQPRYLEPSVTRIPR